MKGIQTGKKEIKLSLFAESQKLHWKAIRTNKKNSVNLQDILSIYRNQLCFCTLTTKYLNKIEKYPYFYNILNNKIIKNKLCQRDKSSVQWKLK